MSLGAIEFITPESVKLKCEIIKQDEIPTRECTAADGTLNTKCGEIFTSNNSDFTLICAFCDAPFVNIVEFGMHLRRHHATCDGLADEKSCIYWDNDESKASIHSFGEAGAADGAAVLDTDFLEPEEPDQIICSATSADEKGFHCEMCNRQFRQSRAFKSHMCNPEAFQVVETMIDSLEIEPQVEEGEEQSSPEKFTCPDCNRQYQSHRTLLRHKCKATKNVKSPPHTSKIEVIDSEEPQAQQTIHLDEEDNDANDDSLQVSQPEATTSRAEKVSNPDLYCDICNRQFKYKSIFKKHGMQHAVAPTALRNDPDYLKCIYCSLKLENTAEWMKHESTHTDATPFLCSFCPKRFRTRLEADMHTNSHTGNRPFKCDQCGASFAHSNNLSTHIKRVHLRLTPFSCSMCDKKFLRNVELRIHIRQHTGEKPYQCEECGRSFMIAVQLNEHRKKHSNVRDVLCPECPMAFFTKKMLRKHMIKHSTERPHVCSTCGRTFSRKKALMVHLKIHQDTKEYVCAICGKAFAQPAGLYSHKKSHLHSTES